MEFLVLQDTNRWDEIVKGFKDYDVYYLSGYSKAHQNLDQGNPMLIFYEDEEFKVMQVVMHRDIADDPRFKQYLKSNTYFDLSTPYGYGGFVFERKKETIQSKKFFDLYHQYCYKHNIVSEFVRFHPVVENYRESEIFYTTSQINQTITLDLVSEEQIWNCLTSENRNVIRKAKKLGVEIRFGNNLELIETFKSLYHTTMERNEAKQYYYFPAHFYQIMHSQLQNHLLFFFATVDEKIISISMILFANEKMHYHLSAYDINFSRYSPNNLLLYEIALWGMRHGYKKFHLGGGRGGNDDNLYKFKAAFNKNSDTSFVMGSKIYKHDTYDYLVELRKQEIDIQHEATYFPLYRI